jgi:hypothetical protein
LRDVIHRLQASDGRIRFFDLPKGPRNGEVNRDVALREARGRIVCYQADDDLWLPGHIAAMEAALEEADFVAAMHVNVDTVGRVRGYYFDIGRRTVVESWVAWEANGLGPWASNGIGLAFVAHRLEAYRRLASGWATAPHGLPTDQYMWHKFVVEPWCRVAFIPFPIALHFPDKDRSDWPPSERMAELARWTEIIAGKEGMTRIVRDVFDELGDRLFRGRLDDIAHRDATEAELARAHAALQAEQSRAALLGAELARVSAALDAERTRAEELALAYDRLLASLS